ncbi:MAG: pyrroline-5-carboxylate reductase [Deltaproteobacteria bacterium]|nr:pyrroline-5-carboxylate reductase [Deltaproteobacteria bacterium]
MTESRSRLKQAKLGFIGAGAMGSAIIRGLLGGGWVIPENITFYDPDPSRRAALATLGLKAAKNNREVMKAPVVVLAVKPQVGREVLAEIQDQAGPQHLIISIAAGVTLSTLQSVLTNSRLIRVMPNTPALVGAGMAAVAPGHLATPEDAALTLELFGAVGQTEVVDEKHLDAVTGLSGSGPAFVAIFIEALADAGVKVGLTRPLALTLATQTVLGAARLIQEGKLHPGALKDQVASPAGTTIEGIHVLEMGGFRGMVMSAVEAAALRAQELARGGG